MDAACGNFDSSKDILRYIIWSLWGGYSLVSGLIRWNKPYIMTDGGTIKIPINGMSGKAVTELLALIDRKECGMRAMQKDQEVLFEIPPTKTQLK